MPLPYDGKLIPLAKDLRRRETAQERHLWYDFLRHYPIRFQRQKAIGRYIADFYCFQARLVIELDGSQHFTQEGINRDAVRTAALEKHQLHVLRFTNQDIDDHFEAVCRMIDREVTSRIQQDYSS